MNAIRRMVLVLVFAVAAAGLTGPSVADGHKVKSGSVTINTKSIGFILGFEWGSGTVTLNNGRTHSVRVRTLKAGMAGLESVTMSGPIYNLKNINDIVGNFTSEGTGITIGGGVGVATLKNAKGVIMELKESSTGVAAKIAASGVDIQLR